MLRTKAHLDSSELNYGAAPLVANSNEVILVDTRVAYLGEPVWITETCHGCRGVSPACV